MRPTIPGIENMSQLGRVLRVLRVFALLVSGLFGLFGLSGLSGCKSTTPPPAENYQTLGNPRRENFVIGTSDVLRVTVWRSPEASAEVRVRPDGNITLPLVGEMVAAGKTPDKLRAEIAAGLVAYMKEEPSVSVYVSEVNSYSVIVLGNVRRPGVFQLKRYVSVSEAVALAGGLTRYAQDDIVVIRTWQKTAPKRIHLTFSKITSGAAPEQDIVLYAGDTVYVP